MWTLADYRVKHKDIWRFKDVAYITDFSLFLMIYNVVYEKRPVAVIVK